MTNKKLFVPVIFILERIEKVVHEEEMYSLERDRMLTLVYHLEAEALIGILERHCGINGRPPTSLRLGHWARLEGLAEWTGYKALASRARKKDKDGAGK